MVPLTHQGGGFQSLAPHMSKCSPPQSKFYLPSSHWLFNFSIITIYYLLLFIMKKKYILKIRIFTHPPIDFLHLLYFVFVYCIFVLQLQIDHNISSFILSIYLYHNPLSYLLKLFCTTVSPPSLPP